MRIIDFNIAKESKKRTEDIELLQEMYQALREAYKCIHPYVKYPLFFHLAKELLMCRVTVGDNIREIKRRGEK